MQTGTLVLIILSAIVALAIVSFQYYYKTKRKGSLHLILSFLRFLAIFCTLLLLINPKFTKEEYTVEKSNLLILTDNSASVDAVKAQTIVRDAVNKLVGNESVSDQFNVHRYSFGADLNDSDSLSFDEKTTNITKALSAVNNIYSGTNSAVVLLTDGNQTLGEDYEFYGKNQKFPIYPVAVGDTTRYEDLRIDRINTNRYAFLKNKYPLEAYISYSGSGNASSTVNISVDGKNVYRERISFTDINNTGIINALLEAGSVGIKNVRVSLTSLEGERNTANNSRTAAVEVIDEKTNIAIISDVLHPDIGTLKKAIESNEQRSATIRKPNVDVRDLEEVDLFILYQPTSIFKSVYDFIAQKKSNLFTITGSNTDWTFLNKIQNSFEKNSYEQTEEVVPDLNSGFTIFDISDFSVQDFPPLETNLGDILITKPSETLLGQRIKGVTLNDPLLSIIIKDGMEREAVLFGENIWKWRMQSYRNDKTFKNFDDFIGKIILYLSNNKPKNRFEVSYENIYQGTAEAKISATYFDEAFEFDSNASIIIKVEGKGNSVSREVPMLLKNGFYEADLSDLPTGQYNFTASVKNENLNRSGSFTILDFDVEQQFLSSDYKKMDRLAEGTDGQLFFPSGIDDLVSELISDNRFLPTQKSRQNVVSLIDFKILLAIIVAALTAEWFIRKYNGLI